MKNRILCQIDDLDGVQHKKSAFTLAEVLITIGIIGVVAAMTLPTLISHHNKKVVETRLEKFYSTMNQAITRSELDNGPKEHWSSIGNGFETDEDGNSTGVSIPEQWFNVYLKPYIKYTDVKINDNRGHVMVYFSDGSLALFAGASIQFWPWAKHFVDYKTDKNGNYINNAELSGKYYFTFLFLPESTDKRGIYHIGKGIEPYKWGWDGTEEALRNGSSIGCRETVSNERAYCAALIQMYGWKIPDDYPVRF